MPGTAVREVVFDATAAASGGTGVGVYGRNLMRDLARLQPERRWIAWSAVAPDPRHVADVAGVEWASGPLPPADLLHGLDDALPEGFEGPTVVTLHDAVPLAHPDLYAGADREAHARRMRDAARRAARVIAPSEFSKRELVAALGIDPAKVAVTGESCHPRFARPVPVSAIAAARARFALPERYALFVGSRIARKNVDRLVEAFRRVREPGLGLVLAGPGHTPAPGVRTIDYVWQEELPALYAGAEMLAFVPLLEGFGIPALEAMTAGTPVLASATSSLPEVVGDAGVLVDPTDVDAIADGIRRVLADRERWIAAGRERAKLFSAETITARVMAVYAGVR